MCPDKNARFSLKQIRDRIGTPEDTYMERRQLGLIRIGRYIYQLRIHRILREDRDPNPHTHPFEFWSFLLKGGYKELIFTRHGTYYDQVDRWALSLIHREKDAVHSIASLKDGKPAVTLVLAKFDTQDPMFGKWGFIENGKFVLSKDYLKREEHSSRRVEVL